MSWHWQQISEDDSGRHLIIRDLQPPYGIIRRWGWTMYLLTAGAQHDVYRSW